MPSPFLFAGNDFSSFVPSSPSNVVINATTPAASVGSYARGDLQCHNRGKAYGFLTTPVELGEACWLHFRMVHSLAYATATPAGALIALTDFDYPNSFGVGIATQAYTGRVGGNAPCTLQAFLAGSTEGAVSLVGDSFAATHLNVSTYDIHVKLDPLVGFILVYREGLRIASYYGDTTFGGVYTKLDAVVVNSPATQSIAGDPTATDNVAYRTMVSEVIVSREKTIGHRLCTLTPNAVGDTFEWSGTVAQVTELTPDDGTYISTDTPDALALLALPNVPSGIATGMTVAALAATVRTTKDASGALPRCQHAVKAPGASAPAFTANKAMPEGIGTVQSFWVVNPETGQDWTTGEIGATQIGIRARA